MTDLEKELRKEVDKILPYYTEQIKKELHKYENATVIKMFVLINGVADTLHWDIKEGRFTKLVYTVGVSGGAFCEGGSGFYDEVEYRELIL
jgi:hypothetical protein